MKVWTEAETDLFGRPEALHSGHLIVDRNLPTQGLWFTMLKILSHLRFMWLFGQIQPNMGDSLSLDQASWHSSLKNRNKKTDVVTFNRT
jgi:hypothetical protein